MPIGFSDLKNVIRMPGTWDAAYLQGWKLKDGTTFDRIVQDTGAALTLFNRSLLTGYWAQYMRVTTDPTVDDIIGGEGGSMLSVMSEYGRPDPIHGDATGHMIPLKDYGGTLGWTYMALRRALAGRLDNDVRRLIERAQNTWQNRIVSRLFTSVYESVGASGKSVPFADGGTADADYIPPTYGGKSFAYTHNHFARQTDDAAGRTASLKAMAITLLEHGQASPFDLVVPEADQALWAAQAEFKKPQRDALITLGVETRGVVSEDYMGLLETDNALFRVKVEPRLPADYAGTFKPLGMGSPDSPLVARYEAGFPLGLTLVGQVQEFPLQEAIAYFTFGVGVGNRIAGAATYYAAGGAYADPTIS